MALITPENIIRRSMRLIGAIGSGEPMTADEATDGLDALNAMLDSWWNERLAVYVLQEQSFALTPALQTYTIGPSGAFVTSRPLKIETAYVRLNSVDYPITVVDYNRWASIMYKPQQGIPEYLYYEPTMVNGDINLWPIPSQAMTLFIATRQQIQSFPDISTTINMPPGYVDALSFNLAVRLAPEYERAVPADVAAMATSTLANIKRLNSTPPGIMRSDTVFLDSRRRLLDGSWRA